MQNLTELTRRLVTARVDFVLVGGFAAMAHGATLVTWDVDVCCRFSEANLMRIQCALSDINPVHRSRPDLRLELTAEQCSSLKNLYLRTDLGPVDCLSQVLGIGNFDEVLARSIEVSLPFGKCRVLSLDALIAAKEAMGRDHDLITAAQLRKIAEKKQPPVL